MKKSQISYWLRKLGLMYPADYVRFYLEKNKNKQSNKAFLAAHPNVKLPPDYLMYESFQLKYDKYYNDGKDTATWLKNHLGKHIELKDKTILDWGCGPGRVIRHLPEIINNGCHFYGTDYNKNSIAWCAENLTGIDFNTNTLQAKLPYENNFFDAIYGISIFTHLSEQMHYDWYHELHRVLKPGGILFLTTHGVHSRLRLSEEEKNLFDNGQLVIRGQVKEGHRTYVAYHPKSFMEALFGNAKVLEHIVTPPSTDKWIPQDIWIVQK